MAGVLGIEVIPGSGVRAALGFVLLGWGIGMAWPHLSTAVLSVVSEADQELAGASVTTVQLTAAAAGAAVGGALANITGFSDPGGVVSAQDAAQPLYPVMLAAPLAALYRGRAFARARADPAPPRPPPTPAWRWGARGSRGLGAASTRPA